jgi:outer membrane lipoprotein-sorting protein
MKMLILATAAAAFALSLPALATPSRIASFGQAAASAVVLTGAERTQALSQASAALSQTRTMQGRFTQIGPDGSRASGAYYMQRPGRARFEYDAPTPLLIVADGATVAIHDRELQNTDRAPLRSTPLHFILSRDVNLERDFRITSVSRTGDTLYVTARDRAGEIDGQLTIALQGPALTLRSWEALDATNARTTVRLDTIQTGQRLSPRLWRTEDLQTSRDR